MSESVDASLKRVLHSGFIGQGEKVDEFERTLQPIIGRKTLLATNSCTSALQLALRLSGVGDGTEVVSTPVTCTATNVPVLACGGRIVWADVDFWTGNIDPESVRRKITQATKAVIAVHWGGVPCDVEGLERVCKESGVKLIFDCAHALGATYKGKPIGSYGDFSCFSFQAIKHVTCGDGGLLSCKDPQDYARGRLLRWYGIKRPADLTKDIPEYGYKFHMNDIAATIGLANLRDFPKNLQKGRKNARYYSETLDTCVSNLGSAYWLQTIHVNDKPGFIRRMADQGVQAGNVHERNDRYTMFKASRTPLPGVDAFYKTMVNIPVGWWVDAERVVKAVHASR